MYYIFYKLWLTIFEWNKNEKYLITGRSYNNPIIFVDDYPNYDFRYAIDASKIEEELGWRFKESFEIGIQKIILWYLNNQNWWKNIQGKVYLQGRLGVIKI